MAHVHNYLLKFGQARKSLWIETKCAATVEGSDSGQARKSLWIETDSERNSKAHERVRLVRACGSKPMTSCESEENHGSGS